MSMFGFMLVSLSRRSTHTSSLFQYFVFIRVTGENPMGGSPGELSEELVMKEKRKKGWRMNCDVGEATGGSENEL